ncbi:uncharacterized protein LOC128557465 [Mercenaria mercenaria]|uniref:uncharacterized protein LOC128557465 n=1 Tax=Mercenaria mercenaria TaxID=6596 RepID=UPI00234F46E0|nr:uncharacterized protein LOC128557465 [Mercenaria mercenaria]
MQLSETALLNSYNWLNQMSNILGNEILQICLGDTYYSFIPVKYVASYNRVEMMYCLWILFITSFVKGDDLQPQSTFRQAICSQDKYTFNITCEEFETTHVSDAEFKSSKWPPGPYAIPMSIYGCPESHMHGWSEGYMSLTWRQRSRVFVQQMLRRKKNIEYLHKLSSSNWPYTETSIYGPSSDSYLKLTFCYKHNHNSSSHTLEWPKRNYSIYATDNSCPSGFDFVQTNVTLPPVEAFTTDGNVPSFTLHNLSDFAILQLPLCSMTEDSENNTSNTASMPKDTSFILLKAIDSACPLIGDNVLEESLLVEREIDDRSNADNSSDLEYIQQYCVYSDIFGDYSRGSISNCKAKLFRNTFVVRCDTIYIRT